MKDKPPWWFELFPDVRAWATIGMFALVAYDLHLIATHEELATNELFKTVSVLLLGTGGFGLLCAFLWGGSKASVAAAETVNEMAKNAPPPGGPPAPVVVTNDPANPVPTTDAATDPAKPPA